MILYKSGTFLRKSELVGSQNASGKNKKDHMDIHQLVCCSLWKFQLNDFIFLIYIFIILMKIFQWNFLIKLNINNNDDKLCAQVKALEQLHELHGGTRSSLGLLSPVSTCACTYLIVYSWLPMYIYKHFFRCITNKLI